MNNQLFDQLTNRLVPDAASKNKTGTPPNTSGSSAPKQPDRGQGADRSARHRKYCQYKEGVTDYPRLLEEYKSASAACEKAQADYERFPKRVRQLEQERDALAQELRDSEEALKSISNGGTANGKYAPPQLEEDEELTALVQNSTQWMTDRQSAFIAQPCEEVCPDGLLDSVSGIRDLETSFRQTALYKGLKSGGVSEASLAKGRRRVAFMMFGGLLAFIMLANWLNIYFVESLLTWAFIVVPGLIGLSLPENFMEGAERWIAGLIAAGICGGIGFLLAKVATGPNLVASLILCGIFCALIVFVIFAILDESLDFNNTLARWNYVQKDGLNELFKRAQNESGMSEMLYAILHHNALMEYHTKAFLDSALKTAAADKSRLVKELREKEADVRAAKKEADTNRGAIDRCQQKLEQLQKQIAAAGQAIAAWNRRPLLKDSDGTLCDVICVEQNSKNFILKHKKKPIVLEYSGDPKDPDPTDDLKGALKRMIRAFEKMNPAALMQVTLIDPISGGAALRMDTDFHFRDTADNSFVPAGVDEDPGVLLAGSPSEMRVFVDELQRHCNSLAAYTASHKEALNGQSGIAAVNKLRVAESQDPFRYQVVAVILPRDGEADSLTEGQHTLNLMTYLKGGTTSSVYGILPVFLVNKDSVHKNWVHTLEQLRDNRLTIG